MTDLVLPAFELDCREWLVVNPAVSGLPDELDGSPLLAVLSTVVIEDDLREATGTLTVGVLDGEDLHVREIAPNATAQELLDIDPQPGIRRYVMPTPNQRLALLAEFEVAQDAEGELEQRVEALMTSFRWQDA